MKKHLIAYLTFTRTERMGLIVLSSLLLSLILVRASMRLWVHSNNTEQQQKVTQAWQNYKQNQAAQANTIPYQDHIDLTYAQDTALPDVVNINTASYTTLVSLKGIGPQNAQRIVDYRKNYGKFTDVEQIHAICTISDSTYRQLKKHLSVRDIDQS